MKNPTFDDYFKYTALQNGGKSVELADRWLLEQFLLPEGSDVSSMMFRELAQILGKYKAQSVAIAYYDGIELDGMIFEFVDAPSALYFEMQRRCAASISEGLKFGILNCYTADGQPLKNVTDRLSFGTAEILSKHIMGFFN